MRRPRRLSVKQKLIGIIMAVMGCALLLTTVSLFLVEFITLRRTLLQSEFPLAEVVGINLRSSLVLHRSVEASEILATLASDPTVEGAYLFDRLDRPFAFYQKPRPLGESFFGGEPEFLLAEEDIRTVLATGAKEYRFSKGHLAIFVPISQGGVKSGTLYLVTDLAPLYRRLLFWGLSAALIITAALSFGLVLSTRLQRLISSPLGRLAEKMRLVSERQDFSVRVEKEADDEIGLLYDGFNEMLAHLEQRDEELSENRAELENRVTERTGELAVANRQLQQLVEELAEAKRAAEQASEAKSVFLANMSHEVRTPMAAVLGMAELLLKSQLPPNQLPLVQTIHEAGEGLLALINEILDLSRIEAGRFTLENSSFNPVEAVEAAVELLACSAQAKGLELVCHIAPGFPHALLGDAGRLRQVINNLLGNAIKFTVAGEVRLRLEVQEEDTTSVLLRLRVSDTGCGIAPEIEEKIFEPFEQGDGSITRTYGGSGLGLAIVREILQLMGGTLKVESRQGEGTTMDLSLRLPKAVGAEPLPDPDPCRELAGLDILVAGGNSSLREMLREHLASLGMRVTLVADAAEAAQALQQASTRAEPYAFAVYDTALGSLPDRHLLTTTRTVFLSPKDSLDRWPRWWGDSQAKVLAKPLRASALGRELLAVLNRPEQVAPAISRVLPRTVPEGWEQRLVGRVLLAEDNPATQQLVRSILEPAGCELVVAANGKEALHALAEGEYDLVLMDVQMPEMDGLETTRRLRARGDSVPVIGFSAHLGERDIPDCFAAGMDSFMRKPFKSEQLLGLLAQWLSGGRPAGPPAAEEGRFSARILVVEDDPHLQRLIQVLLDGQGYELQLAEDGEAALELFAAQRFDLVLMDCNLPRMDGMETTRRLRRLGHTMPVIAMTAHTDTDFLRGCRDAGMDDYLSKPYKTGELLERLMEWLSGEKAPPESRLPG